MRNPAAQGRCDANHSQVVKWYESLHCSVLDMHELGGGCPDLAISVPGLCEFVEVKTEDGDLNASQIRFARDWKGPIRVIRTQDDVIEHVIAMRKRAIR